MSSKIGPKLVELDDPVHPVKSMLLNSVVQSFVSTLAMIPSYPLFVAKIHVIHSQKTSAEWQGEIAEMSEAVSNLTWSSAWKGFGLSCLTTYSFMFLSTFI